jgi:hypothetical protein
MGKKVDQKKRARLVQIGSGNFISQLFFLWVFWLIPIVRRTKNLKDLHFALRKTETSDYNDQILDKAWKAELALASKQNRYVCVIKSQRLLLCLS